MELIEVIDKNGNFTGEVVDINELHNKNLLHYEVIAFIGNNKGQLLLQKRSAKKKFNANKWSVLAGHVQAFESFDHAIIREIQEELGVEVSSTNLKSIGKKEFTIYYYVEINLKENKFTLQQEELSKVKWFSLSEIKEMIKNHNENIIFNEYMINLLDNLYK